MGNTGSEIMARHIPSDQMYLAIYAEARELARTAVDEMDPEDLPALINTSRKKVHKARARKKVHEAQAKKENEQRIKR